MMLEAWEQGIGSCWVGYFNAADVAAALELPPHIRVCAMLPLGYAAADAAPAPLHSDIRDTDDTIIRR